MTNSSMTFFEGRITILPEVCNGQPTIRGKRITIQTILEFLSNVGRQPLADFFSDSNVSRQPLADFLSACLNQNFQNFRIGRMGKAF